MDEILRLATLTLRGMWKYRWPGLATAWGVGLVALVAIVTIPAKYEASARIFVNTDSILKPLMLGLTVMPNEDQRIVMLSRVMISRPNVELLVQRVGLDANAQSREERERIIDGALRSLELRGSAREHLYTLTFRDTDPARAKRAVDVMASMFIESSKGGKEKDTESAKRFIDEQVAVYDKKLQEAESKLKDFRVRYLGMTPGEGRDYFARMTEANNQLNQARLELREAENGREALRRGLAAADGAAEAAASGQVPVSTALTEIDSRLDAMRRNLDGLLQRYTEDHPDVAGAKRVIRDLEEQRRVAMAGRRTGTAPAPLAPTTGPRASEQLRVSLAQSEASVASLSARVAEYSARYERLKSSAALVPQLEAELAQLNRDYEVNKRNYESLVTRRESAAISGDMQGVSGVSDFRLVDPPRVSPRPVSPKRGLVLPLALLLALGAGVAITWMLREAKPAFYDTRALCEATGLPLLGVVTEVKTPEQVSTHRRRNLQFAGGTAALVALYGLSFVVLEFLSSRAA